MKSLQFLIIHVSLGWGALAQGAISIQDFSTAANDRFANDPAFIAGDYDWSGVGRASNGTWATMVSSNVFLSATHFHPSTGATLTFHSGNDPLATPITATVAGGQQIDGTDLWIGYFNDPLPSSIATYEILGVSLTESNFSSSGLSGEFAHMSGVSPTTSGYGSSPLTNQAVGTNRLERFENGTTVGPSTGDTVWTIRNQSGDIGYTMTAHEAQLANGDSGSPLMLDDGEGNLIIAGIGWAVGAVSIPPGLTSRDASIYTYVGNYQSSIQNFIAAHPIPEPGVVVLLFIATAGSCVLRKR